MKKAVFILAIALFGCQESQKDLIKKRLIEKSLGQIKDFDIKIESVKNDTVKANWWFYNPMIQKDVRLEGYFVIKNGEIVKDTVTKREIR